MDQAKLEKFLAARRNATIRNGKLRVASICYFYPQFNLEDAQNLSLGDAELLLKVAYREQYISHLMDLQVGASSQNKRAFTKLSEKLRTNIGSLEKNV